MRESYSEGVAIHTDPESCVSVREDRDEALTGEHMGWVLSRVNIESSGVPTLSKLSEGNTGQIARRDLSGLRAVGDPKHVWKLFAQELGGPITRPRGTGSVLRT
jgi:hypothetical protein